MSELRDILGNTLHVGDRVVLQNDPNKMGLVIGKIVEVHTGGLALGNSKQEAPATVRILIDITLTASPHMPVIPVICKVVAPEDQKLVEEALKPQGPRLV